MSTRRFVLTGAPGAGKTVLAGALGLPLVAEAATDVIARLHASGAVEPWTRPDFADLILAEQGRRQAAAPDAPVVIFDRSPLCTLALARWLGVPDPSALAAEAERLMTAGGYQRQVFLVRPLGFVTPTAARRISYPDSLRFEAVHLEVYQEYGYHLVDVPPGPVTDRVGQLRAIIDETSADGPATATV